MLKQFLESILILSILLVLFVLFALSGAFAGTPAECVNLKDTCVSWSGPCPATPSFIELLMCTPLCGSSRQYLVTGYINNNTTTGYDSTLMCGSGSMDTQIPFVDFSNLVPTPCPTPVLSQR